MNSICSKNFELASELKPFRFDELGADTNLLLRCCAAVMARDASPDTLVNLNGAEVRARFDEVVKRYQRCYRFPAK